MYMFFSEKPRYQLAPLTPTQVALSVGGNNQNRMKSEDFFIYFIGVGENEKKLNEIRRNEMYRERDRIIDTKMMKKWEEIK